MPDEVPGRALVIGCGLGDDAEVLSETSFDVVAFDVSPTAIRWCGQRFPESKVRYCVEDLFHPPSNWVSGFDFVLESYTLQVLPQPVRGEAQRKIASFVAADGRLLVICRGRDDGEDEGNMPWPLTRDELREFLACGLEEVRFEDYVDDETPPVRRFRVEYYRSTCSIRNCPIASLFSSIVSVAEGVVFRAAKARAGTG